jgi:mono/diheme cytochrome c family protein
VSSADTVREGAAVYAKVCAACHGSAGEGLSGPPLVGIGKRKSVEEIEAWVRNRP